MNDKSTALNNTISQLTIHGFKSIQRLDDLPLTNLNVLIGANGSGKSNFVSYFQFLQQMREQRLQLLARKQGGADRILSYGVKNTSQLSSLIDFGDYSYRFDLEPTFNVDDSFVFAQEAIYNANQPELQWQNLGSGHTEAKLSSILLEDSKFGQDLYHSIGRWRVYHFHDTSNTAGVKRLSAVHDYAYLRPDASNLAPPSTIIIDEPELGLHPYAITLLGGLLRSAATRMQVIVSTQSVPLVNEFSLQDLIIVEREQGVTVFKRIEEDDFNRWLEDYSVGELWEKNIFGGRPR